MESLILKQFSHIKRSNILSLVKMPSKYIEEGADRFNFAIATVEPGQEEVTDVAGGGSDGEIQPFSIAAPPGTQVEYIKTYTYYLYDENGNILKKTENIENHYLYTGQELDNEIQPELYNLRARYYDTEIGRFTQEDPVQKLPRSLFFCFF